MKLVTTVDDGESFVNCRAVFKNKNITLFINFE